MAELLVEIRTEELPPSMVRPALEGLKNGLLGLLEGVERGEVRTYATPRRLGVVVDGVATHRPRVQKVVTGPPADRAFVDGKPTQAAIGFAKGKGLDPSALQVVETPKGKFVGVVVEEGGESTADTLRAGLEKVVREIPFHKSMEWSSGGIRFGRPIQGVAAVFDAVPLGGDVAGYPVTDTTVGHRRSALGAFSFRGAQGWLDGLRERWVEPDLDARKARIQAILDEASQELGGERITDDDLVEQVTHLVEWPTKMICSFEAELLDLPPRLLVESMKVHQRVFPVHVGGKLTNRFVVVSNNPGADVELVSAGNARVLRARFHDAKFFFAEDKKKRLEAHGEGLVRMRWIKGLGTMAQKQDRARAIALELAPLVKADRAVVSAAGALTKCDLLTQMVGEFPELQGHMGRLYAAAQGEPEAVALAVEEHYQPRFAGDRVAQTPAGVALALADRLDTLVGCFGIGMVPKGGGDPQGLRRAAIGVVNTLLQHRLPLDLRTLFGHAVRTFHQSVVAAPDGFQAWTKERGTGPTPKDPEGLVEALVDFALARFEAQCVEDGIPSDYVQAVLGVHTSPLLLDQRVRALRELARTPDFPPMVQLFKRVANICSKHPKYEAQPPVDEPEIAVADALASVDAGVSAALERSDYRAVFAEMLRLREPIAAFFDAVMVEDPDASVMQRRVGLLQRVWAVLSIVADFRKITTR
jgi:glycyl-tRNA synthetase beta chain